MLLKHEYNKNGWHRIVALIGVGERRVEGEFTSYQGIAELHYSDRHFIAVTDYHASANPTNGPLRLRPNVVFEISDARNQ